MGSGTTWVVITETYLSFHKDNVLMNRSFPRLIERESRLYLAKPRFQCNFDGLCFDSSHWVTCFYLPSTCLVKDFPKYRPRRLSRSIIQPYLGKVLLIYCVLFGCVLLNRDLSLTMRSRNWLNLSHYSLWHLSSKRCWLGSVSAPMLTFHLWLIKFKIYFQTDVKDADISSSRRRINAARFSQQALDWLVNALCQFLIKMQHARLR